ncbi:hypothetical protein RRG08_001787 [Elysia crispata]|nr:hypothetical protein RRG08_001787 [Elysia crispata]
MAAQFGLCQRCFGNGCAVRAVSALFRRWLRSSGCVSVVSAMAAQFGLCQRCFGDGCAVRAVSALFRR